ncbi:MAG: MMPL family transporter [Nitrospirae bacterium]|nr:MMPL family transporter [Nitrospirota bacterium]
MIGQYIFLFSMSAKPSDIDNVVDNNFQKANIFIQLKTWNTQAMRDVIKTVKEYTKENPTPMELKPAGLAYFNLVWNDDILLDMLKGFVLALVVVFVILVYNFKSFKWALVGYTPLLFTILLIYGVVGFVGKDFDMPISVLSCLLLGMSVDFAIHFIDRFRQRYAVDGDLTEALLWTASRPGKGIMRNAILFVSAFSVMLFAPLTPYMMTGVFIVSMMTLSCLLSIIYLPALIVLMKGWMLNK